nr:reverse transcriptase domain-containing protein [Tanacetum cinerariifolium]
MLKRCEDTNLCLNWEESHFMVKECIVLGHKISKKRIEVDKAKISVISKLLHPTTVKGIRSFLGHAGFYRRFIKDFSKVAKPITRLLEKDTPFVFSQECVDAFQTLKRMLTETPILIAPDWDMPFELMCDASDYAIGVVLGQRRDKHFRPIHYASKTMTEAESKYTTTEKEMLSVVMLKYGVTHRLSTAYHPQTSGQVDVSNRGLKRILERTIGENRASWSDKPDDALWAFRTAYKTPIGCTPYKLVYGKACHLPIELEHKAYWALKHVNFDLSVAGDHRWARSRLHEGTNIFSWPSIIYQNGLKRKRSPPTTLELFQVMLKYGVTHHLSTAYHPQTSGQIEVSNRGLKRILERTIGENRASWSDKLDDALWAFRAAYKTPIGCTPYKLVYGKACHLPIKLEHKAYWALKQANFGLAVEGDQQKVKLNELNKLRDHAYENSLTYKEITKRIHDSKIKNRAFNVGDRVLLFNSRLKIFSSKLKTRWSGPFTITKVFPYGTVELSQANGPNFKVNGKWVKLSDLKQALRGRIAQIVKSFMLSVLSRASHPQLHFGNPDCPYCEVSRALSFCLLFTRASHPQLHFGNP